MQTRMFLLCGPREGPTPSVPYLGVCALGPLLPKESRSLNPTCSPSVLRGLGPLLHQIQASGPSVLTRWAPRPLGCPYGVICVSPSLAAVSVQCP